MKLKKETILLADIINYSLKGLTGAMGRGEGITKNLRPLFFHVSEKMTRDGFVDILLKKKCLEENDIIVLPSKIVSLLEKRFVYGLTVENYNRCINNLRFARKNLKNSDNGLITEKDQIGLDKIDPERKLGVRYPSDPNFSAYEIAKLICKKSNIKIDVIISDSDSGGKKGQLLIGCPTLIATPIGATKGIRLFYCMRLAVAAEMIRNNVKDTPVLLVNPYQSTKIRQGVGEFRYHGFLSAFHEEDFLSFTK